MIDLIRLKGMTIKNHRYLSLEIIYPNLSQGISTFNGLPNV